jgi:DNA-binding NtrC family response regulator
MTMPREKATILVVEDDTGLRELIREELEESGHSILEAKECTEAMGMVQQHSPDLVISDLRLPGDDGLGLLEFCRKPPLPPAFIMITAFGTVEQAVDALKRGADDFLTKPLKLDHLSLTVMRVLERRELQRQVAAYREMVDGGDFQGMIGRSPPMRQLFEQIRHIARAQGPVLVLGESGVGKELVARALHRQSERNEGPFIAMNCAGIPVELLESELFGHSAGAFTGASKTRKGLFAEAEGGTLLLDEVGEMPPQMQSKLLRILQDGSLRPVGENHERSIDVRIVAATNRDLEAEVEAGRFRADLFYRLETFSLEVPPLRERGDDIDLLAAHFLSQCSAQAGVPVESISIEALERLRAYSFPGNVRELSNAIERAVVFCRHGSLELGDLPTRIRTLESDLAAPASTHAKPLFDPQRPPPLRTVEKRYVEHMLKHAGNNKQKAARLLGIGRRTLYRYLEKGR